MANFIRLEALQELPLTIWLVVPWILAGLLLFFFNNRSQKNSLSSLPVAEKLPGETWLEVISKATKKFPKTPYILPLPTGPRVILPLHLVPTILTLPDPPISRRKESYRRFAGPYTRLGIERPAAVKNALRVDLTRNIGSIIPDLQEELEDVVGVEIGDCSDAATGAGAEDGGDDGEDGWKQIALLPTIMKIVSALSARTFVGQPLCRDPQWRGATLKYAVDLVAGIQAINGYHPLLRPLVAPFVKSLQKLRFYRMWVRRKLRPTIEAVIGEFEGGDGKGERERVPHGKNYDSHNLIHWILNNAREQGEKHPSIDTIADFQLFAAVAAIQTTGLSTTNAMLDLATYPQYADELREEIESVIAEEKNGGGDGTLNKNSMGRLRKLDSFMRESQRCNPLSLVSLARMVTSPTGLNLPDGITISRGTSIAFPMPNHPSIPLPPDLVLNEPETISQIPQPPLSEFHPFRYSDLRSPSSSDPSSTNEPSNKFQFAATSPTYLNFGHGWQACPGRFFASNEIKLILVEILRRYDIALGPGGKGTRDGETRPKNTESETAVLPDLKAKVYLRNRLRKGS